MPYESTMAWNPDVNLLVRKNVGGLSVVDILLRIDGTVAPLRSWGGGVASHKGHAQVSDD